MKELVLLIGMPGSGKDTQANLLEKNIGYKVVRIGEEVRKQAKQNPRLLSQEIHGKLADPAIVNAIVERHLKASTQHAKIVCDGYPRSMQQTMALEKMIELYRFEKVRAVYIDLPKEEVLKRLSLRGREDDNKEAVLERIRIFKSDTQEVLGYYASKGQLKKIDGIGSVEEVQTRIIEALT